MYIATQRVWLAIIVADNAVKHCELYIRRGTVHNPGSVSASAMEFGDVWRSVRDLSAAFPQDTLK